MIFENLLPQNSAFWDLGPPPLKTQLLSAFWDTGPRSLPRKLSFYQRFGTCRCRPRKLSFLSALGKAETVSRKPLPFSTFLYPSLLYPAPIESSQETQLGNASHQRAPNAPAIGVAGVVFSSPRRINPKSAISTRLPGASEGGRIGTIFIPARWDRRMLVTFKS